ncbi:MAG: glycosyltransferase family 4 protein [Candidatus Hodarchaeota archaeon]
MKAIVGMPWNLEWEISGLAKQLRACFNAISDLGVNVKLFSLGTKNKKMTFSVSHIPVKTIPEKHLFSPLINSIAFSHEFAKRIDKEKYDILHCFKSTSLFLTNRKFLFQAQDPTPASVIEAIKDEYPNTSEYQSLLRYYASVAELFRQEYEKAELIITLSEVTKENIIKYYGIDRNKIEVIPNGVAPEECNFERRPENSGRLKIVLFPSTIEVKKGFHYLVEAMTKVRKKFPETILMVCGRIYVNERKMFKEIIERKRKESGIVLAGFLPREKLFNYYREADVCCIPKLYGNMSNAILESVAQGLPIVTTKHSGFPQIDEVGIKIPSKDSKAIAEAIITLLSDPQLWRRKSEKAQKVIKDYQWNRLAKKFVNVYKKLI